MHSLVQRKYAAKAAQNIFLRMQIANAIIPSLNVAVAALRLGE